MQLKIKRNRKKEKRKKELNLLVLVRVELVADAVAIIPGTGGHNVIEVSEGVDDPRVLTHGPTHVHRTTSRDPAVHERQSRFLLL